jgi:isopenicillin N synthase-like dioxygenase
MFEIRTVSYADPAAPAAFTTSLRDTGFAVLTGHPIDPERIEATYAAWGRFFASEEKHGYTVRKGEADGYFPFRSENAKGQTVKDLKEFFHVYPSGRIPPDLRDETLALHADLAAIGQTLLGWIQDTAPPEVTARFSEPLPDMLEGSGMNLLRILHYPAVEVAPEPGAVRAAAHGDINLITLLLAGSEPGLQAKDTAGNWHDVPCDPGMMAINAGDMLEMASGGYFPSTVHQVVNPPATRNVARFSMPMFCHPRPEVVLKPGTTADDFLTQRLREIGLA